MAGLSLREQHGEEAFRAVAGIWEDGGFLKPCFWSPREMTPSVDTDLELNGNVWQENQGSERPTLV